MTMTFVNSLSFPVPISSNLISPGTILDYTLENFDPPVLNGKQRSLHINESSFSFPLANDPGQVNVIGSVARYIDMAGGIFQSTFIYRNGSFEVTP
jgi:hypothetical protein